MVIDLTPEQEADLQRIAEFAGKTPQQLILDAVFGHFAEDMEIDRILDEREVEAQQGVFIEHAAVKARFLRTPVCG